MKNSYLIIRFARTCGWTAVHESHSDSRVLVGAPPGVKAYSPLVPLPFQEDLKGLSPEGEIMLESIVHIREAEIAVELDVAWQKSQRGRKHATN